ncbi:MAG: glycosyltransferase family 2 protein [Oscillospiraceae bacterium]|nr:glycosyltransferase family 2 protein [Oscillospiraceae bacterium]
MPTIAVLIPCYNEELTVGKVISDFQAVLPGAVIYVYDNASTDRTAEAASGAGAFVRHEPRRGKGNTVRSMFRHIDADCYVLVDGDDTYPASVVPEMCAKVLSGQADMVVGDRLSSTYAKENKRRFHGFGNRLVRGLINFLFKSKQKDIMSGLRVMSRDFVKMLPVTCKGFEIETEMTVFALDNRFVIEQVPIGYRDRPEGSVSKLRTYSDGAKVFKTIFMLYRDYCPMHFFGFLSLFLMLAASALFIPILIEYLQTGLVPRFPTLIVSVVLGLGSMLSFFAGLILVSLAKRGRQQFEILYNLYREGRPK